MRARNRAHRSARTHSALTRAGPRPSARRSARTRTAQRARAPLRAHALNAAAVQMCRSVPCGPCMRRKVRDRTCLGWEKKRNPNSTVPPCHSHLLPLAGLAGGRRCSFRRAPRQAHPATAACGQWSGRRMSAHGCRHGRPAAVAGTACPRRLHENGSGNA
jgi:hypothetical protein